MGCKRLKGSIGVLPFVALLALWAPVVSSAAAPEPSRVAAPQDSTNAYLRFQKLAKADQLQVAIASFLNDKTGVRVDLVGAIHIGDKAYYEALNKRFKDYDAVLFELVADPRHARDLGKAKNRKESGVTSIQRFMQNGLDLEFQLDAIDYSKANFIHADMDPKTFDERRKVRGETMFNLMWKTMQEEMARQRQGHATPDITPWDLLRAMLSDNRALEMKRVLGSQMIQMEGTLAGLDSGEGTVIVNERNDIALGVLKKTADGGKKRIAIFYGAAHMPDMERKLLKSMGYSSTDRQWLTAWNLPKATPKAAPKTTPKFK